MVSLPSIMFASQARRGRKGSKDDFFQKQSFSQSISIRFHFVFPCVMWRSLQYVKVRNYVLEFSISAVEEGNWKKRRQMVFWMSQHTASNQTTWRFGVRKPSKMVEHLEGNNTSPLCLQTTFSQMESELLQSKVVCRDEAKTKTEREEDHVAPE